MLWKRTFLLLLFLLTLVVIYLRNPRIFEIITLRFHEQSMNPATQPAASSQDKRAGKLVSLAMGDQIVFLSFENFKTKEKFSFEKKGNDWLMTTPLHFPAAVTAMNQLVGLLEMSARQNVFRPEPRSNLTEFGFSNPSLRICTQSGEHPGKSCFVLADDSPLKQACYGRLEKEDEIFLVSTNVKKAFQEKTKYTLLRKQIFPFTVRQARMLAVRHEGLHVQLDRQGKRWEISSPIQKMAAKEKVEKLLAVANNLHIREFIDRTDWNNPEFGLNLAKQNFIMVKFSGSKVETVWIGNEVPTQSGYYGRLGNLSHVFLLSKEKIDEAISLFRDASR